MDIRKRKLKGYVALSILIIMCLIMASAMTFFMPNNSANAFSSISDIASQSTNLGKLLLDGYENSAKVFNEEVLWELIGQISDGEITNKEQFSEWDLSSAITAQNIRGYNNGKDVTINIGGKIWTAAYVSRKISTEEGVLGDPILTLWLATPEDNIVKKAQWNKQGSDNSGNYPNNMYGTSWIRASVLNNGGGYAATYNASSLTPVDEPVSTNEWAMYTMPKTAINTSISEFIEVPNNMQWQHSQSAITSAGMSVNFNNDALDFGGNGSKGSYATKTNYAAWGNDKVWLPSIAEAGISGESGLWKLSENQRSNTDGTTWTRSAYNGWYSHTYVFMQNGGGTLSQSNVSKNSLSVRPAFHLNLASAANATALATPQTKGDVKKFYSEDSYVTFELDKIKEGFVDVSMTATDIDGCAIENVPEYSVSAEGVLSFDANIVGEYTVTITPKEGYVWINGSRDEKSYKYYVKYSVPQLVWAGTHSSTYNGKKQYFEIDNYDADKMDISGATLEQIPEGETNAGNWAIAVKNADDYLVTVRLKNSDFMEWAGENARPTQKTLPTLSIAKRGLNISVGGLATEVYTKKVYELLIPDCCDEDIGKLRFDASYASVSSGSDTPLSGDNAPQVSATEKKLIITLPAESTIGNYTYKLSLRIGVAENSNYELKSTTGESTITWEKNFEVTPKIISLSSDDIKWVYNTAGGENIEVNSSNMVGSVLNLPYTGNAYNIEVDTTQWSQDMRDCLSTQLLGDLQQANVKVNNGEYSATFTISPRAGSSDNDIRIDGERTFTLRWKINKAKFNLSNISWNYTAPFEFNEDMHEVVVSGLPSGLSVDYDQNWAIDVGSYTTTLSLTIDDNMRNNYEVPIMGQPNTYIYNGSGDDVPWTLPWQITVGTLNLEWEKLSSNIYTTSAGRMFVYPTVLSRYDRFISGYKYYLATDYNNGCPVGTEKTLDDIVVMPEQVDNYYVVAILDANFVGSYDISATQGYAFTVGSRKKEVILGIDNNQFTYDTNAHGDEWRVVSVSSGTAPTKDKFTATFYSVDDRANALSSAPTDAGDYVIKFVIASATDANIYELVIDEIRFEIIKSEITATPSENEFAYLYDGTNREGSFDFASNNDIDVSNGYIVKTYYKGEVSDENKLGENEVPCDAGEYVIVLSVVDAYKDNYAISGDRQFTLNITSAKITATQSVSEYMYDGSNREGEFTFATNNGLDANNINIVKTYYKGEVNDANKLANGQVPSNAGTYTIVLSVGGNDANNYYIDEDTIEFTITITPAQITAVWNTDGEIPMLSGLSEEQSQMIENVYTDSEGNAFEDASSLEAGNYTVMARIKSEYAGNYVFVDEDGQVLATPTATEKTFEIKAEEPENPDDPITPVDPTNPEEPLPPASSFDFSKILDFIKANWQSILAVFSLLLTIIFMGKGMGYAGKRKKVKKTIDKRYTAYYAISGVGLFGLPNTTWTMIACIMAGVALLAFIFMLLQKKMYNKALEDMEDAKEEYTRNREESNFMRYANGGMGMGQQGVVYAQQPQFAIEDMRGMINEAMSNMLPNVTQYLPQEASYNEELIQQLMEQNAQNEERMRQMNEQNEERIRQLTAQNEQMMERLMDRMSNQPQNNVSEDVIEKLAEKLAKQQAIEKEEAEKEAAAAVVNEKTIEELKETIRAEIQSQMIANAQKAEKDEKDEKIEMLIKANESLLHNQEVLMERLAKQEQASATIVNTSVNDKSSLEMERLRLNQEMLMHRINDLAMNTALNRQQIVPIMQQPTERIIEKPVEKIVEKEVKVEVPVEKIVEKEVVKEVPVPVEVEKIVEVEKVVEKVVPMPVEKPAKESKAVVPRLTLDEAYAKLTASQKKIFDTLKNYAMSKDKCKENKSTYFTVLGQSSVNPLVKLTIKKNTTVAMFKMEDEYFKDIRRGASSDGTKMKVKETELVVSDAQALATAKNMVDLREDQIERYNDFLKEQKSMRKK